MSGNWPQRVLDSWIDGQKQEIGASQATSIFGTKVQRRLGSRVEFFAHCGCAGGPDLSTFALREAGRRADWRTSSKPTDYALVVSGFG
jgi:hypothetical protein